MRHAAMQIAPETQPPLAPSRAFVLPRLQTSFGAKGMRFASAGCAIGRSASQEPAPFQITYNCAYAMAGCAARCEGEDKLYTTFILLDLRRRERSNDHRCTRGASRMIPRFRQVLPPPPHEVMKIRRVRVFGDSLPLDPASLERPELEACLELFTRLTRSTRSAESTPGFGGAGGAGGAGGREGRAEG